ncbi:hypothetical protein AC578_7336 [Pseudocercospora eumusae]|uniref:Uncharacterized protein n=1 Tax=Pseudocercospora eumusae TaxID=321146 RepID=A0A139HX16_9PEZI|nr:hypothetical protein AC578_7336 [Pseudocercospora eumusae]
MAAENMQSKRHLIVRPIEDYVEQFEQFVRYGDEMVKKEPRVAVMKEWYANSDSAWEMEEKLCSLFAEVTAYIHGSPQDGRSSRHATLAGFLTAFGFDVSEAQAAAEGSLWVEHGGMESGKRKQKQKDVRAAKDNRSKTGHEGAEQQTPTHLSGLTGCRSRQDWSWKACVLELFRPGDTTIMP